MLGQIQNKNNKSLVEGLDGMNYWMTLHGSKNGILIKMFGLE